MNVTSIISSIDAEIAGLQHARAALVSLSDVHPASALLTGKGRGRPKGSTNVAKKAVPTKTKRVMSPEGKAKIAAAQKKRWAAAKKSAK